MTPYRSVIDTHRQQGLSSLVQHKRQSRASGRNFIECSIPKAATTTGVRTSLYTIYLFKDVPRTGHPATFSFLLHDDVLELISSRLDYSKKLYIVIKAFRLLHAKIQRLNYSKTINSEWQRKNCAISLLPMRLHKSLLKNCACIGQPKRNGKVLVIRTTRTSVNFCLWSIFTLR